MIRPGGESHRAFLFADDTAKPMKTVLSVASFKAGGRAARIATAFRTPITISLEPNRAAPARWRPAEHIPVSSASPAFRLWHSSPRLPCRGELKAHRKDFPHRPRCRSDGTDASQLMDESALHLRRPPARAFALRLPMRKRGGWECSQACIQRREEIVSGGFGIEQHDINHRTK